MSQESIKTISAIQFKDGISTKIDDSIIVESTVNLYLNKKKIQSLVASFTSLEELGAGFFIASGITRDIKSVKIQDNNIFVEGTEIEKKSLVLGSSGELDTGIPNVIINSPLTITPEEIFSIRKSLDGEIWDLTGGLHCTALYYNHQIVGLFTDIGRHNTVDKAIGYMVLHHLNPGECIIGCTGRQPRGMVLKAANTGIPIIISRTASTTAGIETAEKTGLTLICFTRKGRFTIYTHPERVSI